MASKLTQSNGAGWLMALPGVALITTFIILPFFLAFAFSLTNQRLASPNPVEYVGFANYEKLLGVALFKLEPERDDAGQVIRDDEGQIEYPRLRKFTRKNPDYPHLEGNREWFSWAWGEDRMVVLASDVVFMKALINTFLFVLIVAPLQSAAALGLALLINQKLKGINIFRVIYFMPVVVSIVVVSLLWRFIYSDGGGLLNNILGFLSFGLFQPHDWLGDTVDSASFDHGHVDLAGRRLSHGHLARRPADDLADLLRSRPDRRLHQVADLPLHHLAGP